MKEQLQLTNYSAWLYGRYQLLAIGAAMSKRCKYPTEPFYTEEKEVLNGEERFKLWIGEFNRKFEKEQSRGT